MHMQILAAIPDDFSNLGDSWLMAWFASRQAAETEPCLLSYLQKSWSPRQPSWEVAFLRTQHDQDVPSACSPQVWFCIAETSLPLPFGHLTFVDCGGLIITAWQLWVSLSTSATCCAIPWGWCPDFWRQRLPRDSCRALPIESRPYASWFKLVWRINPPTPLMTTLKYLEHTYQIIIQFDSISGISSFKMLSS